MKDVVTETLAGGLAEIRMSAAGADADARAAQLSVRAVYENTIATAEFKKARASCAGLWEKVRERPEEFLDPATIEREGVDAAARDFVAGNDRSVRRPAVRAALHPEAVEPSTDEYASFARSATIGLTRLARRAGT